MAQSTCASSGDGSFVELNILLQISSQAHLGSGTLIWLMHLESGFWGMEGAVRASAGPGLGSCSEKGLLEVQRFAEEPQGHAHLPPKKALCT